MTDHYPPRIRPYLLALGVLGIATVIGLIALVSLHSKALIARSGSASFARRVIALADEFREVGDGPELIGRVGCSGPCLRPHLHRPLESG